MEKIALGVEGVGCISGMVWLDCIKGLLLMESTVLDLMKFVFVEDEPAPSRWIGGAVGSGGGIDDDGYL